MKETSEIPRLRWCLRTLTASIRPKGRSLISYGISRSRPYHSNSEVGLTSNTTVQARLRELRASPNELYPRVTSKAASLSCRLFIQRHQKLLPEQTAGDEVVVRGRVNTCRVAGSKLFFIDLLQEGLSVQGLCNFSRLSESGVSVESFRHHCRMLRRGDIISLKGFPHRTRRGELSVVLSELPHILSPCLHPLPTELLNRETKIRHRYVDFLVNPRTAHILRLKAAVIEYLRSYLAADGQVEIQTPILADEAGGAVARPFQTSATEFPDRELSLRIAPELWLKRLVIGGFDRVFEIGPSFRNEGLDSTHNPEFTTCEFYRTYTDLEDLMNLTENLLLGIATHVAQASADLSFTLNRPAIKFADKFARLDFVSGIEAATNRSLPSFKSPDALGQVARYLQECSMQLPANPTLPRLLDHLSSQLLEPQCMQPTWITNYPECLSPLAKSIDHPTRNQRVSARAELFVNGQEIVNTYEEENSPFEQRRKFVEQLEYRADGNDKKIDEEYLAALEWGLPPTGGWGCGVDRLTMLMLGTERIGDVLSFGNLRNVVASRRTP